MKYQIIDRVMYCYFDGEFDYQHIAAIKNYVISLIEEATHVNRIIFDFEEITFVDSTGIGFVIARYKQCCALCKTLEIANLSKENRIIFEMSGIFQIIKSVDNGVKL